MIREWTYYSDIPRIAKHGLKKMHTLRRAKTLYLVADTIVWTGSPGRHSSQNGFAALFFIVFEQTVHTRPTGALGDDQPLGNHAGKNILRSRCAEAKLLRYLHLSKWSLSANHR